MKAIRNVLLIVIALLVVSASVILYMNYGMLNILTGYAAKNLASSVFIGQRSEDFTQSHDNNFSPVDLASASVNKAENSASASVFGLMKRTAIYREGLGCTLINDTFDQNATYEKPRRMRMPTNLPYPYGELPQRDTSFANIDYAQLNQAVDATFDRPEVQKTRAVLVIYKDHIVAEKYAEGFDKNSLFLGWSMTKSVLATCFGILQTQGKIDIYEPAPVPEWQDDARKNITTHNLLQMNSGLAWDEDYGTLSDVTKMLFLAEDVTQPQALKEAQYPPNEHWNYSSGTTNLLSGILRKQFNTHQAYLDFPYQALIDRIGMHSFVLETDMSGNFIGSSYCWGTARDWAKFGLLYLHEGNWNGEQIFGKEWANYVREPAPNAAGKYGGHFWLNSGGMMPDVPRDNFSANGFQGQQVSITPSKDLVIVRFGLAEEPDFDFNKSFGAIIKAIQ